MNQQRPTGKTWCLLKILLSRESPSTMEIVERCRMTRPGSVVHHLRKNYQVPIETVMVQQRNSYGEKVKFAKYQIASDDIESQRKRFGLTK